MEESKRYSLNKKDVSQIGKVFVWSMASSVVSFLIVIIPQINVPADYAAIASMLIPIVNTGLVGVKKLLEDKGSLL